MNLDLVKNVSGVGLILYAATMLLFFGLYLFGMNTEYFNNTVLINAFVLPALYVGVAYYSVHIWKKAGGEMSFTSIFGRSFKPMFIGGILSILTMFVFLNFIDKPAKDLLNYQYIERQKTELTNEYEHAKLGSQKPDDLKQLDDSYNLRLKSFSPEMVKDKDMFSFRQFTYYFGAIMFFYVILSIFFASFFRTRSEH